MFFKYTNQRSRQIAAKLADSDTPLIVRASIARIFREDKKKKLKIKIERYLLEILTVKIIEKKPCNGFQPVIY